MTPSILARAFVSLAGLALVLAACSEAVATPSATESARPTASPEATSSTTPEASEAAATESAEAEAMEVMIIGSQYVPEELTIAAGTEVTFVNHDTFAHTVTEGSGGQAVDNPVADEDVDGGESIMVRFDGPGTYDITCRFHPTMQMTITVEG